MRSRGARPGGGNRSPSVIFFFSTRGPKCLGGKRYREGACVCAFVCGTENKKKKESNPQRKKKMEARVLRSLSRRCPVYGRVSLSPMASKIAEEPRVSRLMNIRQLGMVFLFRPWANHCRFEHSLGVAHLARTVGNNLLRTTPMTHRHVLLLEIAGLLHDVGHGPFSHVYDKMTGTRHEDRSVELAWSVMRPLAFSRQDCAWVAHMIDPSSNPCPEPHLGFLGEIISNTNHHLDVDRTDYLLRDPLYTDTRWRVPVCVITMLERSRVRRGHWEFADRDKPHVASFLAHRERMYRDVYCSPRVKRLETELSATIQRHGDRIVRAACDLDEFVHLTDDDVLSIPHVRRMLKRCDP